MLVWKCRKGDCRAEVGSGSRILLQTAGTSGVRGFGCPAEKFLGRPDLEMALGMALGIAQISRKMSCAADSKRNV